MAHLQDLYTVEGLTQFSYYFTSKGPNGSIKKAVVFEPIEPESVIHNLALGDITNTAFDDLVVSNNADTWKVLATVAESVRLFLEQNPGFIVFAQGNTPARTRLYRMGIAKYYPAITSAYEVLGYTNGEWKKFGINRNFEAFLIYKKSN